MLLGRAMYSISLMLLLLMRQLLLQSSLIFDLIYLLKCNAELRSGRIEEYCDTEVFRAECSEGEVVVLEKARYGRMRIGRCVEFDMGHIGCSTDVLRLADRRCSGRRVCELRVPDAEFEGTQPCLKELKTYLEASYTCVKVDMVQNSNCKMADELNVTSARGYLASVVSPDVYHCPHDVIGYRWVIRGRPLQRINLTLYDFSSRPSSSSSPPAANPPYAVAPSSPLEDGRPSLASAPSGGQEVTVRVIDESSIVDSGRSRCRRRQLGGGGAVIEDSAAPAHRRTTVICPRTTTTTTTYTTNTTNTTSGSSSSSSASDDRISHLYLSEGNVVRIWLPNDVAGHHDNHDGMTDRFLIHYAVIGCAFPTLPEQTWFRSDGNWFGIMGCVHANVTWSVECREGIWNISSTAVNCSTVATEEAREKDLTIGPIRFAFDRFPANQERVSYDEKTHASDYAGIIILTVTALIILIVIIIIIAGLRNCSLHAGESNRSLCPEAQTLRQTSGETPEAELRLEGLNVKCSSRTPAIGSRSRSQQQHHHHQQHHQQQHHYTLWRAPSTSSSHQNYLRAADDSV